MADYKVELRPWQTIWALPDRPWQLVKDGLPIGFYPTEAEANDVLAAVLLVEEAERVREG